MSRDSAGRWFVSMLCEDAISMAPATNAAVGLDAGITSLVTLSTGEKITNPKHERRDRARLARAQRELSRKAKNSNNRAKARVKVVRVHARIADRRRDFLHKLSTRLVRENQTDWPAEHLTEHLRTVMTGTVDELEKAAPRV